MKASSADSILHLGEEIANSITHGVGTLLAIGGLIVLVVCAALRGTVWHVVSCSIYGASLVVLYLSSTLYHALSFTRARRIFRIFDHSAIYLLIAGTYTPFVLVSLRTALGVSMLVAVWALGIGGIVFKSVVSEHDGIVSTTIYVLMGWLAMIAVRPLMHVLSVAGFAWLIGGGVFYTLGVIFFAMKQRYAHSVWHIFVLGGSICHYIAILRYVILR